MSPRDYDSIIRENIKELYIPLIRKLVGIDLNKIKSELLPKDLRKTVERDVDFVRKIIPKNQKPYILHIEFQSTNSPEMVWRMVEYRTKFTREYKLPVEQYVIYIGNKKMNMEYQINEKGFNFFYHLLDIRSVSYKDFIYSNSAEEVVFAILTDFEGFTPKELIKRIFLRIRELESDSLRFGKYVNQLEILSKIRNLQDITTKQISIMPIEYDLKTDIRFLQGKEQGFDEGEQVGLEKGEQIGLEKGEQIGLEKGAYNLLKEGMTIKKVAQLMGLSIYKVRKIKEKIAKETNQ